jgi:hypothetical protein
VDSEFDRLRAELEPLPCGTPRALEISRRLVELDPASVDAWEALARDLEYSLFPDPAEARPELASDPRLEELVRAWDTVASLDDRAAGALYNGATALRRVGAYGAAARKHLEAGRREQSITGGDPEEATGNFSIAAECAAKASDIDTLEAALDLWEGSLSPGSPDYAGDVADIATYRATLRHDDS